MKITLKFLENLKTEKGGYTRETLQLLGVSWPPKTGWKKSLIGKEISDCPNQGAKED